MGLEIFKLVAYKLVVACSSLYIAYLQLINQLEVIKSHLSQLSVFIKKSS